MFEQRHMIALADLLKATKPSPMQGENPLVFTGRVAAHELVYREMVQMLRFSNPKFKAGLFETASGYGV